MSGIKPKHDPLKGLGVSAQRQASMILRGTCPECQREFAGKKIGRIVYCEHCARELYRGQLRVKRLGKP